VEPASGGRVRLNVSDEGCGFAAGDKGARYRFGYSAKRIGRGYGLHATARFVWGIGGESCAESPGLDCGATFTVVLSGRIGAQDA
jgi:sensor histidine kinase regulating citrate/malate metabolism